MPVSIPSAVGAGPETVRLARADAITHREALEAVGIDAQSPVEVLRRIFCRGTRARNVAMLLSAVLISTMALTARSNDGNKAYLYAPSGAYSDDAHLESHHWTHFRHGAPVIVVARNLDDLTRRTALFAAEEDSARFVPPSGAVAPISGRGTTRLFRRLAACLADPTTAAADATRGAPEATNAANNGGDDENGFATGDGRQRDAAHEDHAAIGNLRAAVDPAVLDPEGRPALQQQQQRGRHITRTLQWDRLIFVITNVTSADSPAVRCLTLMQASAAFQIVPPTGSGGGDWVSTHGGLTPPVATHHIGVALPRRRPVTATGAAAGAAKSSVLARFHLLLAPTGIAAGAAGVSADELTRSADAVHGFAWWAAQRIKHTPPEDAVLAITPPGGRGGKASDYSLLDDAIMSRWYHEHHSEHASSAIFKPKVNETEAPKVAGDGVAAEVEKDVAAGAKHAPLVNPVLPAMTVELTSALQVVGPVTVLHDGTQPSSVPLVLVVRPDGFGVYRSVHAEEDDQSGAAKTKEATTVAAAAEPQATDAPTTTAAAAGGAAAAAAAAAAVVGRRRPPTV